MLVLLATVGCGGSGPAPALTGVTPPQVPPGGTFAIGGAALGPGTVFFLQGGKGALPLPVARTDGEVRGTLPPLAPGSWTVIAVNGGGSASTPFEVVAPLEEVPCARPYQANTALSLADGTAVVERFYADGTRQRVETALGDIERLELVQDARPDGSICSAILLRRTDGVALIFEDDGSASLRPRAETLARYMRKALAVPEDVPPL